MDDIDRYLESEHNDPEYRRYLIQTSQSGLGSWLLARLARVIASWPRRHPTVVPLPEGEQRLGATVVKLWSVGPGGPNLHCVSGSLWLTKTGDPRDYILVAGQSRRLEPGPWVIQALAAAQFRVYSPTNEEVPHGQASLLSAF